ncbi:alanine--tRNA ligase [Candidatus Wolfebacteria bacterium]|nr:alanine--tRNA ligase [Candidatus Wolfebacteria bacterium]
MNSEEIRQSFLQFFKEKGHFIVPSYSLVPENDPTSLFISAGMQPMIPYLLGESHPEGKRITDAQKCIRTIDIEEIGDNRHLTFFEMLGNWSLGDYYRKEQLSWFFEFLINKLKLDPNRLYATVFRGNKKIGINKDIESVEILKALFKRFGIKAKDIDFAEKNGMQGGRIFYYDESKNWWSRAGAPDKMPLGEPGGPDSEIFYDLGAELKIHEKSEFKDKPCHLNCDCGRFIEIGNSVFMEYIKTEKGFNLLSQKNVDFGGGLERLVLAVQNQLSPFETDLFKNIIIKIEELAKKKYIEFIVPIRIIADHLRATVFIVGDDRGIKPSNVDQGYIVRRLIRRAFRYGRQIGIENKFWMEQVADIVINDYEKNYPELRKNRNFIIEQINKEEEKFSQTLENGLKEFEKLKSINGKQAFNLYSTYGFPIEMTKELAQEKGIEIDEKEFETEIKKHKELSKTASIGKFKGGLADSGEKTVKLHTAAHLLLAVLRKVLGEYVEQKGSNITSERLRFDFSYSEKLTDKQINQVEKLVNEAIKKDLSINCNEMFLDEAKKQGAMGVFESKYGEKVKVYSIGEGSEIFSKEICGGPHAKSTGELGRFKIIKQESSSAGVRRIKAILE